MALGTILAKCCLRYLCIEPGDNEPAWFLAIPVDCDVSLNRHADDERRGFRLIGPNCRPLNSIILRATAVRPGDLDTIYIK